MTQAVNGITSPTTTDQSPNASLSPDICDFDTLERLKGLSAIADYIACGVDNLGPPLSGNAMRFFAAELSQIVEGMDQRAERLARQMRRARQR